MDIKFNEATPQRPNDHVLDAPVLQIDLQSYLSQLLDEPTWHESDKNSITVFKTPGVTMVLTVLREGATMIENTVDGLLSIQVLAGQVTVNAVRKSYIVRQGQLITVHAGIPHELIATADTQLLLTTTI